MTWAKLVCMRTLLGFNGKQYKTANQTNEKENEDVSRTAERYRKRKQFVFVSELQIY